jgi:hypothetical protein
VFMCKTAYDFEFDAAAGGTRVYASVEDLKECRACVEGCGIVEVRIELVRVVQEEKDEPDEEKFP